jgi:hypothetical protein
MEVVIERILCPLGLWSEELEARAMALEEEGYDVRVIWYEEYQSYEITATRPKGG